MTRFIGVISGKGGVGKTTTAINLAGALNDYGKDVIVVDGNLTTPNIGIHLGNPILPITLNHVLQGRNHISEAIYESTGGMKVIPSSISLSDLKKTDPENLSRILRSLYGLTDIVVLDGSAGLGKEATMNIDAVDEILIVTNPELPAVTDALKTIRMAEELGKKILGVIVCRTKEDYGDLADKNIEALLDYKILATIPEDKSVREALNKKDLVISVSPKSKVSLAYRKLAAGLIGEDFSKQKKGFFKKIFEKLGWGSKVIS